MRKNKAEVYLGGERDLENTIPHRYDFFLSRKKILLVFTIMIIAILLAEAKRWL